VVGARVVVSLPLDLRANWTFRTMPFGAGFECLAARRRALFAISVLPAWILSAAALFSLWPWRPAAAHLAVLALLGIILAEFSFNGVQKIPSRVPIWRASRTSISPSGFWIILLVSLVAGAAENERHAFQSPAATAAVLGGLAMAAAMCVLRNYRWVVPGEAELRFEEIPPHQLLSLDLWWNGGPAPPSAGESSA